MLRRHSNPTKKQGLVAPANQAFGQFWTMAVYVFFWFLMSFYRFWTVFLRVVAKLLHQKLGFVG